MNKHLFEIETRFQTLYTFNIHHVNYFKFIDDKKQILINMDNSYKHYPIALEKYNILKNNLINLIKSLDLNYMLDNDRYIFLNRVSGLCMYKKDYFLSFKTVTGFYKIDKSNYYKLLNTL